MKNATPPKQKQRRKQKREPSDGFVLTKQTLDKLLRHNDSDAMIALYTFLSYTALWQRTNQPHATVSFIAKGLGWGVNKVRRIRTRLVQLGMIEDLCSVDPQSKKIIGWYVRVSYFHPHHFREGGKNDKPPSRFCHSVDSRPPNALRSGSTNALRADKTRVRSAKHAVFFDDGELISEEQREAINYYNETLAPLGWLPVTKFSPSLALALERFDNDADGVRHIVDAVAERPEDVLIPKRKTLVRLLWDNY